MEMRRANLWRCLFWTAVLSTLGCSEYDLSQDQTLPSLVRATASSDAILVQFDEVIEASSLSYHTFTVHDEQQREITREGQFYLFDEFIEFRAEQAFQSGKKYHVTLSGLTDRAANPLPKTVLSVVPEETLVTSLVALDQGVPLLLSHIPEANAHAVELNQLLILNFSEPMNCASLQTALTLSGVLTELRSCQNNRAVYQPFEALQAESSYEAVLLGAMDLAGNLLPFSSWIFSTVGLQADKELSLLDAVLDLTAPKIVSLSPKDGSSDVDHNAIVTVYFDEAIKCSSARLEFDDLAVLGSVRCDGNQIGFTPQTSWDEGSFYSMRLSGVEDLAGNVMQDVVSWSFSIE